MHAMAVRAVTWAATVAWASALTDTVPDCVKWNVVGRGFCTSGNDAPFSPNLPDQPGDGTYSSNIITMIDASGNDCQTAVECGSTHDEFNTDGGQHGVMTARNKCGEIDTCG